MIALSSSLSPVLERLLEISVSAGALVVLVLMVQAICGRWLTPRWRYALWGVVVVRLLMPVVPGSVTSLANLWLDAGSTAPSMPAVSDTPIGWTVGTLTPDAASMNAQSAAAFAVDSPRVTPSAPPLAMNIWLAIWSLGGFIVIARAVWQHLRLTRWIRRDSQAAPEAVIELFAKRCRAWSVGRPVTIRITDSVTTPTLSGLHRPVVLLPPGITGTFSAEEIRHIFDHELAHLRSHDLAANWGLVLLTALHWFNPLVWFAFHRLRLDREPARDAMVLAQRETPPHPRAYGHTLIRVLELLQAKHAPNQTIRYAPAAITVSMSVAPRHARRRFGQLARHRPAGVLPRVLGVFLLSILVAVGCTKPVNEDAEPPAAEAIQAQHITNHLVQEDAATTDAHLKLSEPIVIDLSYTQFDEAIEFIRQTKDVLVFVDWPTIEAEGISRQTPVSMTIANVPAAKILQLILQQVSPQHTTELDYAVTDGVVTISTRAKLRTAATDLRVYDIRDLLTLVARYNIPPFNADGIVVEDPSGPQSINDRTESRAQAVDHLTLLIQETVGRIDDWEVNGGPDSIRELNGNLVIKTTPECHRQIVQIIQLMRQGRTAQVSVESRLLMIPTEDLIRTGLLTDLTPLEAKTPEEASTAWRFVNELEAKLLVESALANRDASSFAAPRFTVFSGQTGYVTNANQRAFIQNAEIVPGQNAFDITVGLAQSALTLIATASWVKDGDETSVVLEGRLILLDKDFDERPVAGLHDHPQRAEFIDANNIVDADGEAIAGGKVVVQVPRAQAWRVRLSTLISSGESLMIVGPELTGPLVFAGEDKPDTVSRSPVLIITPTRITAPPQPSADAFPGVVLPPS